MSSEKWGSTIGAAFGLAFLLVNTGSLPTEIGLPLRVLGVVAFIAVLVAVRRAAPAPPADPARGGFTRVYWLVVAAEVVAIVVGLALLNGPLDLPHAAVAWIALVVGVHFFALAVCWKLAFFHWLGAAIALCGAVGLVLAATAAAVSLIDVAGGVVPGGLLLGFGLWGSTRAALQYRHTQRHTPT